MTWEDKELLIKDLSSRLPYGVIVKLDDKFKFNKGSRVLVKELLDLYCIEGVKPYLRPMSSMTEEEIKEYKHLVAFSGNATGSAKFVDWLNTHHLDYRDLIPMGLAIEAPKDMYKL